MKLSIRLKNWLVALIVSLTMAIFAGQVHADDPVPPDPTLTLTGGGSTVPVIASEEAWADLTALVYSLFSTSDYESVSYYGLVWFNLLPPDYAPPPPPPEDAPPPGEDPPPSGGGEEPLPPPTVASAEDWDAGCLYLLLNYDPDLTDDELINLMLLWYNLLPPDQY